MPSCGRLSVHRIRPVWSFDDPPCWPASLVPPVSITPHQAHRLVQYAQRSGQGTKAMSRLFEAVFEEGKNISSREVPPPPHPHPTVPPFFGFNSLGLGAKPRWVTNPPGCPRTRLSGRCAAVP